MCALAETTPCPLYEDETIVQQPADFLKLSETYSTAATGFIHEMAGMYSYKLSMWYNAHYQLVSCDQTTFVSLGRNNIGLVQF